MGKKARSLPEKNPIKGAMHFLGKFARVVTKGCDNFLDLGFNQLKSGVIIGFSKKGKAQPLRVRNHKSSGPKFVRSQRAKTQHKGHQNLPTQEASLTSQGLEAKAGSEKSTVKASMMNLADDLLHDISFGDPNDREIAVAGINGFQSKSNKIRLESFERLLTLAPLISREILLRLLAREKGPTKLKLILRELNRLNEDVGIEKSVFEAFLNHSDPALRLLAVRAFEKYKGDESYASLSALAEDEDAQVREAVAKMLIRDYPENCSAIVLLLLSDPNVEIKKMAIKACGTFQLTLAVPTLIRILSSAHRDIAEIARESLRDMTGQDFGPSEDASAEEKRAVMKNWQDWWQSHQQSSA